MEPMLRFLLILQASCCCCFGWRQFESPLELAQPNSDGIYEFDLLVEQKLTMSSRENGGEELRLAQFNVDQARWSAMNQNGTFGPEKLETGWQDLLQLDGRHTRVLTINGHSPGQVLVVPLGAKVAMKVRNRLPGQAMTIHLHGMDKLGAWWTDGVAFVQQCPIQPGQDFVYRFIADTPGTLWYHGHLMNDRADGLLGGFVVKQLNETAPEMDGQNGTTQLGRDYYAILQDWSTVPSTEQWLCHVHTTMKWLHGFDEPTGNQARQKCWAPKRTYDTSNIGGSVPLSAILVGEKGWHSQEDIRERPSHLPLTTFPIKKGENVRLRLVNGGISQGFMIWAEGHEVWVLAADGAPVKSRKIDALIIYPGERYDILIKGLDAPTKQRFWLQIETMEVINWDWSQGSPQLGLARLHYEDFAEVAEAETEEEADLPDWSHSQCTAQRKCLVLNCPFGQFPAKLNLTCLSAHLLESAEPLEDRELVEQKVFPADKFHEEFANMHSDNHIEGWMFSHPSGIPYFHEGHLEGVARPCDPTKCDHENSPHWEKACQCFVHFNFSLGSIVQLTIYNMGDMANPHGPGYSHPIHVHGTHFLLVKVGYGGYHADGSIRTMNPDIPCTDPNSRCIGLRWANDSWLGGNVPDMVANPSWRDTVNIPSGGYITIRFRAKNPGWWFAHCHLMLHNMGGTAFAFRVGSHQQVPKPPDAYPHSCGIYQEP